MLIHTIDAGRRSGWAFGAAGAVPNQGYLILRKESEPRSVGLGNMIAYLDDVWRKGKPDLMVYEAPMTVGAWAKNAQQRGFTGGDAIESGFELAGIIEAMCDRYQIRCEVLRRQTILAQATGTARWPSRKEGKLAVKKAMRKFGMIPKDCDDEDISDAVALHFVASGKFAKCKTSNFGLFQTP